MILVVPMQKEDVYYLRDVGAMKGLEAWITDGHIEALIGPNSFTAIDSNQVVLGCAGVIEKWPGRAEAWAFLNPHCRVDFVSIHKEVKKFLNKTKIKRIEAVVDLNFEAGHRWVKALGFTLEAPVLKSYGLTGNDCSLYARVKP